MVKFIIVAICVCTQVFNNHDIVIHFYHVTKRVTSSIFFDVPLVRRSICKEYTPFHDDGDRDGSFYANCF